MSSKPVKKHCMGSLIHTEQSGFLKGRNIGNNIRLILDIIEYCDKNDLPGSIILLDIEKAFDSVKHDFLIESLKQFNFGDKFVNWIKVLYTGRQSYVMNNGFLTERIPMQRGIFQGCPVSPYLFLFVIEIMALMIRQSKNIKSISVKSEEVKISLLADDSVCFLDGSKSSFEHLFKILDKFGLYSGCKINLSKTEAIWIGSKRGCQETPLAEKGISWKTSQFKPFGINFSLNVNSIFDLNYKEKLKRIEQTINCWRMRNLSLIGKICVIKSLVLPQLLYLFSVLCIKIPKIFFKELNTMFYSFIWNGCKDRVQRNLMYNDFQHCGLKMIDAYSFSIAQKMTWIKCLLDDNFHSTWKTIELSFLEKFHEDKDILWKSHAPENVLNSIGNSQVAESIRSWYIFRQEATKNLFDCKY